MKAAAPDSLVVSAFMGPEAMAAVYRRTALNVHPALCAPCLQHAALAPARLPPTRLS